MPNIPRAPGVPALSSFSATSLVLLVADAIIPALIFGQPTWGVFQSGTEAIEANSVVRFDYRQDWTIADYPVELGGFQSYDKVQLPYDVRLRLASGSSPGERQAFIEDLQDVGNSIELFDVLTPETAFVGVNCSHIDWSRTATAGANLIVADVWFSEIREGAAASFSDTAQPQEAGQQNAGNVQPLSPTSVPNLSPNLSFFQ